jgi:competence ComEA-like helix-hairpin-helix protein
VRPLSRWILVAAAAFACAFGSRLTAEPASRSRSPLGQELAPGAGKELVLQMCTTGCHGVEKFMSEHRSKSQWIETLETMKTEGATGTDADFKTVLGYLVAHAGIQVKINVATAKQIDDALDLEPGQAEAIVKYRDEKGKFADWPALMSVPGLDPKKLEEQKANVVFSAIDH